MMKEEFEKRLGREVSLDEYKEIEFVYNWHPALDYSRDAKGRMAELYNAGGMGLIRAMTAKANEAADIDKRRNQIRASMIHLSTQMQELQKELDTINAQQKKLAQEWNGKDGVNR